MLGGSGNVCPPVSPVPIPPSADLSTYLLWTTYGVTPEHATTAAQYLAERLEPFCPYSGTLTGFCVWALNIFPRAVFKRRHLERAGTASPRTASLLRGR